MEELVLSFHSMGPKDQTEVINLGYKHLYQLNHFTRMMLLGF